MPCVGSTHSFLLPSHALHWALLTPGAQCDHMVGRPQILLKRGTDQECRPHEGSHQKSIHAPLRRAHIQPHRDPRPAGQQREASAGNGVGWPAEHSELVEDGAT